MKPFLSLINRFRSFDPVNVASYLFAVVGGILHTDQVSVGPPIQIGVLATDVSVACVAGLALTAVHGIGEMSQVVTTGIFVAVVASVETGITRRAHLESQEEEEAHSQKVQR